MFVETQRFDQWWLRGLFVGINGLFALGIWQRMPERSFDPDAQPPTGVLVLWGVVALLTLLFFSTRLLTRVDSTGVHVRFAPWQRGGRHIPWEHVKGCRVRRFRPLVDFGGWGWRCSLNGRLEGYTTRGDQALELDLGDRRSLLIGTRRAAELTAILQALGKSRPSRMESNP